MKTPVASTKEVQDKVEEVDPLDAPSANISDEEPTPLPARTSTIYDILSHESTPTPASIDVHRLL